MNPDAIHDVADKARVAEEILGTYDIRVDPEKHALYDLEELEKRLEWADKIRREFSVRVKWQENNSDTLRTVYWELHSDWLSYD
jgi:hypothetical protein